MCTNTGVSETGKCKKSVTIDVKIYCSDRDYVSAVAAAKNLKDELALIYKLKDFAAHGTEDFKTIYFSKLEEQSNYILFNTKVYKEMTLNIIFVGAESDLSCSFTSNMILDVQIQKNVFPLQKMSVNVIGQASKRNFQDKLLLKM